jgi:hypothetical protein
VTKIDHEWTDYPVCPYCGSVDQDWWDGLEGVKKDGDSWKVGCYECDKYYSVRMCVDVIFDTWKTEDD